MEHDEQWDRIFNTCPNCKGQGILMDDYTPLEVKCSVCNGSGKVNNK